MKRLYMLIGMLVLCSILHAQNFSIDGHLATDFSTVAPTLSIEVNLNKIDILAGTKFWIYSSERADKNYQTFNTDSITEQFRFEIFAGIAPKLIVIENWTLTLPILAKINFRKNELSYDSSNTYSADSVKTAEYFGFGLDLGPRAYYALSEKWNFYFGFLFEIFLKTNNKNIYWKTLNTTYSREYDTIVWFEQGKFELGVRYTF